MRRLLLLLIVAIGAALPLAGQVSARAPRATTTLTFMCYSWSGTPGFQKVLARFAALHPEIKIKQTWLGWSNYWTKVETEAVAGQPPDVFINDPGYLQEFAFKGLVLPLDNFLKRDNISLSLFYPAALASGRWSPSGLNVGSGPLVAFPWDYQSGTFYYNKTMFQQAGVPLPAPGWTWNDVLADAQKLTKKDASGKVTQWGMQLQGGYTETELILLTWAMGGRYWTPDLKKIDLLNSGFLKAMQLEHDMIWKDKVSPPLGSFGQVDPFMTGKVAMMSTGTWQLFPYQDIKSFAWDVAPIPRGTAPGLGINWSGGDHFSIAKATQNPNAAWELLKFLAGPGEGQQMIARQKIEPPVVKADSSLYYSFHPPAHINLILESFKNARPEPNFYGMTPVTDQLNKIIQQVLLSPGPIEPTLRSAQGNLQNLLDQQWSLLSNH